MVAYVGNHSYWGSGGRRILSSRSAWEKVVRPCLKNKIKTKKGWGHGSSDRVLA
jgi:hypothetical protein